MNKSDISDYDNLIVRHCSPTLAGIKPSSLFTCHHNKNCNISKCVSNWNRALNNSGIFVKALKHTDNYSLIYLYRKDLLQLEISDCLNAQFLKEYGYKCDTVDNCLSCLVKRLNNEAFPHEIGIFLGYPLEDVKAFILNAGSSYLECGCWKAYSNSSKAREKFALFNLCTRTYCKKFAEGYTLTKLVSACK